MLPHLAGATRPLAESTRARAARRAGRGGLQIGVRVLDLVALAEPRDDLDHTPEPATLRKHPHAHVRDRSLDGIEGAERVGRLAEEADPGSERRPGR